MLNSKSEIAYLFTRTHTYAWAINPVWLLYKTPSWKLMSETTVNKSRYVILKLACADSNRFLCTNACNTGWQSLGIFKKRPTSLPHHHNHDHTHSITRMTTFAIWQHIVSKVMVPFQHRNSLYLTVTNAVGTWNTHWSVAQTKEVFFTTGLTSWKKKSMFHIQIFAEKTHTHSGPKFAQNGTKK